MTEKMIARLDDLRARQQAGEHMRCPRCGQDTMKPDLKTNALSRHVENVYICDSCGTAEALLDFMKQELPLTMWAICKPLRPASGFGGMTAADVLAKTGYEIPFTRIFFEFVVPSFSSHILSTIVGTPMFDYELQTITNALRVELHAAKAYKDSGVEWIGQIPVDWEVNPISYYFTERNERCSEADFPPLSVTKRGIVPQLDTVAKSDAEGDSRKRVHIGDFVINSRSDRKQSCGVSDFDGSVSLINIVLQPKSSSR